ncbi:hypothetical protein [Yinghuangia soli]|uniref:Uncharacterized protein n=1 Tax=Yinghuangia soli TaxID=2908204 RepID=A0AA41PZ67_9ACTN|nr:hypothetical protein [Yinghuangia soli]MCF2528356.1 hypothetical protein [Yinghuangia soli]
MITDDDMHDLFARAIPDDEPSLTDFRPVARAEGTRLRRRRRIRVGAAAIAFTAVLGGTAVLAVSTPWSESGGRGSAAASPSVDPVEQLRAALAADPALAGSTVTLHQVEGLLIYAVTHPDGSRSRLDVQPQYRKPVGSPRMSCGGPEPRACEWAVLSDGSQAAVDGLHEGGGTRADGFKHTWLEIVLPDGQVIGVSSTNVLDTNAGFLPGDPLPQQQLLGLAKNPAVLAALRAIPYTPVLDEPAAAPCTRPPTETTLPGGNGKGWLQYCGSLTPPSQGAAK